MYQGRTWMAFAQVATPSMAFTPARGLGRARMARGAPERLARARMTATLDERSTSVEAALEELSKSSSLDPELMKVVGLPEGIATCARDAHPNPSPIRHPNPCPALTLPRLCGRYDRDATVAHFAMRPGKMAGRALDFLQVRVRGRVRVRVRVRVRARARARARVRARVGVRARVRVRVRVRAS